MSVGCRIPRNGSSLPSRRTPAVRRALIRRAVEALEQRRLLHGDVADGMFHADVNFQPASSPPPDDYYVDAGRTFGDRGNGLFYGWNADNTPNSRDKNSTLSIDQRYDTLVCMQKNGSFTWQIQVPNGQYDVHVVCGDAGYYDSNFQVNVEGKLTVSGKPTNTSRWVEGERMVTVADGVLTISNAAGSYNNKLSFIDIDQLPVAVGAATITVSAPDSSAIEDNDVGVFRFTRAGDNTQDLAVTYLISGTATPGVDYAPLSGTVVIPAGQPSTMVTVDPIDDDLLEPGESVTVTAIPDPADPDAYAPMKLSRTATVWIIDDETSSTLKPYLGAPARLSGTVQAEDFDFGPSGTAYKDNTTGNAGGTIYRLTNADIQSTSDVGGGFAVTHLTKDEWMKYTILAPVSGTYRIETRLSTTTSGGNWHVSFDGTGGTGQLPLGNTTGSWKTITKTGVTLSAGVHTMKFYVDSTVTSGGEFGSLNWIRVYNDLTGKVALSWSSKAALPLPREEAETASVNGKLYMMGGFVIGAGGKYLTTARVDCYDPSTNTWTRLRDMPEQLTHTPTVVDPETGKIYLMGGFVGNDPGPGTAHVWIYDTNNDAWTPGPNLPEARGAGAASLIGREIHFVGGRNGTRTIDEADHWALNIDDLDAGWTSRAPIPFPRNHFPAVTINGKMYTVGGQIEETQELTDKSEVQVYDPDTDSWSLVASLPLPLSHMHTATVLTATGKIVTFGGETGHNTTENEVLMYDPSLNLWSLIGYLPSPRRAASAGIFGNKVVLAGGEYNGSQQGTTWTATLNV